MKNSLFKEFHLIIWTILLTVIIFSFFFQLGLDFATVNRIFST